MSSGSERTCIVTGEKGPPEAMLRFALAGDGVGRARHPPASCPAAACGRGSSADGRQAAAQAGLLARLPRQGEAPPALADDLDALLERDALQFLSMVNKAGSVVTGASKVEAAIAAGDVVGADSGAATARPTGRPSWIRALRADSARRAGTIARINLFSSSQLDLALGRTNVIHAALKLAQASAAFLARAGVCANIGRAERTHAPREPTAARPASRAVALGQTGRIG